jgi:hypothetical protein
MREPRGLGRLAGLVTLTWAWLKPALLLPGLVAVPASGCLCDCGGDFNNLRVASSTPMTRLDVAGDGCGTTSSCEWAPEGNCREFVINLVAVGTCHVTATATDGRQASTDVTVTLLKTTCCGRIYGTGRADEGPGHGPDTATVTFTGGGDGGG